MGWDCAVYALLRDEEKMTEKLKPLTDDEIIELIIQTRKYLRFAKEFARAIETAYEKLCELEVHHMHAVSHEREECAKIAEKVAAFWGIDDADREEKNQIAAAIKKIRWARGKK